MQTLTTISHDSHAMLGKIVIAMLWQTELI